MAPGKAELFDRFAGYFGLQIAFAELLAERRAIPLTQALGDFTNLRRRFGLGNMGEDAGADGWNAYAERLASLPPGPGRIAWTRAFFLQSPEDGRPATQTGFGCFACEAPNEAGVLRIHFGNRDGDREPGPLTTANIGRRRAELTAMFAFIRQTYPNARAVQGGSWLYNLDAYRRLFPPDYGASRQPAPEPVRLGGTSTWGQVIDHHGALRPEVHAQIIDNLKTLDADAPWRVFPLRAQAARAPIKSFYEFYGV